jgi:large subunit ribosomal protein L11e
VGGGVEGRAEEALERMSAGFRRGALRWGVGRVGGMWRRAVCAQAAEGKASNPMRAIQIDKVVLNISVGESGDRLTFASKVLEQLTGQKPLESKGAWGERRGRRGGARQLGRGARAAARGMEGRGGLELCVCVCVCAARYTVRQFGIRRNEKIATHVTVRGEKAMDLLDRGLKVKDYELNWGNFSDTGCFGFGIKEHIDLGVKYDPSTGIFGMDFFIILKRPGARVARRKHATGRVGAPHRVTKEEAQAWFKETFKGILTDRTS